LFTSDENREFAALYAMDLQAKKSAPVVKPDWDVEGAGFSHAWKYFFTLVNADGQVKLEVKDTQTKETIALPAPPPGGAWVPLGSSPTDRYLVVRLQGDGAPAAPYLIDMSAKTARRLIDPLPASLQSRKMAVAELVHIPSFDGRKVPAFLYKPAGAGPFPTV